MELKHLITAGGAGASPVVHPLGRPLLDARLDTLLHLTTSEAVLAQVNVTLCPVFPRCLCMVSSRLTFRVLLVLDCS